MGTRQQEKSDMTRAELTAAMERLFLEKGYAETSVKDITEAAGYAVGSFYRHWKSKEQAFLEYCDDYVSGFIRQSVDRAPLEGGAEDMLDYLLERSELFANSEKTTRLYVMSRLLSANYSDDGTVAQEARRYTDMLLFFLRRCTGCRDETRLLGVASLLHTVLDNHALRHTTLVYPPFTTDDSTLRTCLLAIVNTLRSE